MTHNYILADRQELTAYALQSLLKQNEKNILMKATDKAGLIELLKAHPTAIVVLDFTLFDFPDGDSLLITSERFSEVRWLLLSDELTRDFLRKIIYSSLAFSVVFKDESLHTVCEALKSAESGSRFISQRATETVLAKSRDEEEPAVLTATETEIAKAIAQGKTTKEIAAERFSSVHTITTHRKNIFRKLGVNTAHEVVRYALRAGWVDASDFYI